jgi:hypothetical protein
MSDLADALGEKLGTPTSVARSLLEASASQRFHDAIAMWLIDDANVEFDVDGFSVAQLSNDFGIPTLSALLLLASVENDSGRLYPRLVAHYEALRRSPHRPAHVDTAAIGRRVVQDAGHFDDSTIIGYEIAAAMPEVQVAFWEWFATGVLPDMRVAGFSAQDLLERKRHPVQVFLTLDWLIKEPARAREFMSGE